MKLETFEIEDSILEGYFVGTLVRHRRSNIRYWIINVYGPTKHDMSLEFVQELSAFCERETLPILMGGDFNLIRSNKDRNRGQGDQKLMDIFNDFIGNHQLREIFTSGPHFTWSNKQKNPILVKLDKVLATKNWESQYPTCFS